MIAVSSSCSKPCDAVKQGALNLDRGISCRSCKRLRLSLSREERSQACSKRAKRFHELEAQRACDDGFATLSRDLWDGLEVLCLLLPPLANSSKLTGATRVSSKRSTRMDDRVKRVNVQDARRHAKLSFSDELISRLLPRCTRVLGNASKTQHTASYFFPDNTPRWSPCKVLTR